MVCLLLWSAHQGSSILLEFSHVQNVTQIIVLLSHVDLQFRQAFFVIASLVLNFAEVEDALIFPVSQIQVPPVLVERIAALNILVNKVVTRPHLVEVYLLDRAVG